MCTAHSDTLGRTETLSRILSIHKDLVKGHLSKLFIKLMNELLIKLFTANTRVSSFLKLLFVLSEALFVKQIARSSRRDLVCPSG